MFDVLIKKYREIRVSPIAFLLPERLRFALIHQLAKGKDNVVHLGAMKVRWVCHKFKNMPEHLNQTTKELLRDWRKWGRPEVCEMGLNAVPDVGEDSIIAALTGDEAGLVLTADFDNANAHIGVGDSNTAFTEAQTDLIAGTNRFRDPMEASYPQDLGAQTFDFRSQFASGDANFAWEEWGVFNHVTFGMGEMLSRKVESLGTKSSGQVWTLTATYDLSGV